MQTIKLPKYQGNQLLFQAISRCNVLDMMLLLETDEADCNARNINGSTPLHYAVRAAQPNLVQILCQFGADVNLSEAFEIGAKTPLHQAVEQLNELLVIALLENGANPNLPDKAGLTALHYAARVGHARLTQTLILYGADPHARDKQGFNPAYWAQMEGHTALLKSLPPPRTIKSDDYVEYCQQLWEIHQINVKVKKPKGKRKVKG